MRRNNILLLLATVTLIGVVYVAPHRTAAGNQSQNNKPTEIKIDPKKFDDYVGQYATASNPDLVLSFYREGETYYVQATNQGRIEIFPASESKFFVKLFDAQVTFIRGADGKVTSIVWEQEGRTTNASKTSNQPVIEKTVAFDKREEMIRMRDGVRLHTLIFSLKNQTE